LNEIDLDRDRIADLEAECDGLRGRISDLERERDEARADYHQAVAENGRLRSTLDSVSMLTTRALDDEGADTGR
jgi:hypothetical protein